MKTLLLASALLCAAATATTHTDSADGEIRKIDKEAKKLTIRHGKLEKLDMPPMTMVFQIKDPAMLDKLKAGDKVRFSVERTPGGFVVTDVQPSP